MPATPLMNRDFGVANADDASSAPSRYTRRYLPLPPQPSVVPFAENPLYTKALASWREARQPHSLVSISDTEEKDEEEKHIVASLPTTFIPLQSPPPVRVFHAYYGMGCDGSKVPVEDLSQAEIEKREGKTGEKEVEYPIKTCVHATMTPNTTSPQKGRLEEVAHVPHAHQIKMTLPMQDADGRNATASIVRDLAGVHSKKYSDLHALLGKTVEDAADGHLCEPISLLDDYARRGVVLRWGAPRPPCGLSSPLRRTKGSERTPDAGVPPPPPCPQWHALPWWTVLPFPHATAPIAAVTCGRWRGEEEEEEVLWGITVTGVLYRHGMRASATTAMETVSSASSSSLVVEEGKRNEASGWERMHGVAQPIRQLVTRGGTVLALSRPTSAARLSTHTVVYCWGNNREGQCMRDPRTFPFLRQPIRFGMHRIGVQSLACGGSCGVLVFADGVLGVWGTSCLQGKEAEEADRRGGATPPSPVLQPMPWRLPEKVVAVSAGESHAAAVTDMGRVWTWGVGARGRLGHGGEADERLPRCVVAPCWEEAEAETEGKMAAIYCGALHTVACSRKGAVWVWGDNRYGQLGLPLASPCVTSEAAEEAWVGHPTPFPSLVTRSIPVMAVGCGDTFTCLLLSDGDLLGCGVFQRTEAASGRTPLSSLFSASAQTGGVGPWRWSSLPLPPRRLMPDYLCLSLSCGATHAASCGLPRQIALYVVGAKEPAWWGDERGQAVRMDGQAMEVGPRLGEDGPPASFSASPMRSPLPWGTPAGGGEGYWVFRTPNGRRLFQLRRRDPDDTKKREEEESGGVGIHEHATVPPALLSLCRPERPMEQMTTEWESTASRTAALTLEKINRNTEEDETKSGGKEKRHRPMVLEAIAIPSRRQCAATPLGVSPPRHQSGSGAERVSRQGHRSTLQWDHTAMEEAVASVSCGPDYAIAVTTEGRGFGWGVPGGRTGGRDGKVATTTAVGVALFPDASPRWLHMEETLSPPCRIAQVACGRTFVVVLLDTGGVYQHTCSGNGEGDATPERDRSAKPMKGSAGGRKGDLGWKDDVEEWGKPVLHCLRRVRGFFPTTASLSDAHNEEEEEEDIVMVAAGDTHALALSCRGAVFAWGKGVLGHGPPFAVSSVPCKVRFPLISPSFSFSAETSMRCIGCGPVNSFALFDNGELFVWGCNQHGQCGMDNGRDAEGNEVTLSCGQGKREHPSWVVPSPWKVASTVQCAAFGPHTLVVIFEDGSLAISGKVTSDAAGMKQKEKDAVSPDASVGTSFCTLTRMDYVSCGGLSPLLSSFTPLSSTHHTKNASVVSISCVSGYDGVVVVGETNRPSKEDVSRAVDDLNAYLSGTVASSF